MSTPRALALAALCLSLNAACASAPPPAAEPQPIPQAPANEVVPPASPASTNSIDGTPPVVQPVSPPPPISIKLEVKASSSGIDHAPFDALLKAHVDPKTHRVSYAGFKKDEAKLDAYLKTLATAELDGMSRDQRFAFYVNAYNANTIKLILEKYPKIASIRDVKKPWKTSRWKVAGETLSLDEIEHKKLRPVFKDPRIHFAVNCASIGCPPLRAGAYTARGLESQLDEAAKMTVGSDDYVTVKGNNLYLSSIFDWYGKDFINPAYKDAQKTLPGYIKRYAKPKVVAFIESKEDAPKVKFLEYSWKLNDAR